MMLRHLQRRPLPSRWLMSALLEIHQSNPSQLSSCGRRGASWRGGRTHTAAHCRRSKSAHQPAVIIIAATVAAVAAAVGSLIIITGAAIHHRATSAPTPTYRYQSMPVHTFPYQVASLSRSRGPSAATPTTSRAHRCSSLGGLLSVLLPVLPSMLTRLDFHPQIVDMRQ